MFNQNDVSVCTRQNKGDMLGTGDFLLEVAQRLIFLGWQSPSIDLPYLTQVLLTSLISQIFN